MEQMKSIVERLEINGRFEEGGAFDHGIFFTGFSSNNCNVDLQLNFGEGGKPLLLWAMVAGDVKIPEKSIDEVIQLANIFNQGAWGASMVVNRENATFWMKFGDNSLNSPEDNDISSLISDGLRSIDFIHPAVMKIIHAGSDANDAYASILKSSRGEDESSGASEPSMFG